MKAKGNRSSQRISLSQIAARNEIVKEKYPLMMHLFARQDKKLEYVLAVG
jgi:hypothetical protein